MSRTKFHYPDLPCRMLFMGKGPGPKNVMVEYSDGTKLVVTYGTWKHRLSKQRRYVADSEGKFVTVVGSVEFDPESRQVQGKDVLDVSLRSTSGKKVRATLWPNLAAYFDKIEKGQLLGLKGKGSTNTVDGDDGPRTYNNLSVSDIVILGAFDAGVKPERDNASTVADDDIPF